jgi:hypothetical protein
MALLWGMRGKRTVIVLGCAQVLFGCGLIDDCNFEERSVTGFNAVIENGEATVRAEIVVAEKRGSLEWKSLNASITGTLKGHVTSIFLINTANPSAQLAIPLDPPSSPAISSGGFTQRPGDLSPDLAGLYEMIASNLAVLQVTTDLPSRPSLTISLTVTSKQDWFRPHNCY